MNEDDFKVLLTLQFPDGKVYYVIASIEEAIQLESADNVLILAVDVYQDDHS